MSDNLPTEIGQTMPAEMTIDGLVARFQKVKQAIAKVCVPGVDLMKIPGVDKPIATKSFAEKMGTLFMLAPAFEVRMERDGDHREYFVTCRLTHSPTGTLVATCDGSCSTKESKYRYRNADRVCPNCGKATIIKGKAEYGGGFLCFAKKGGCGAKFADGAPEIVGQVTGRVENPDIADVYNTVSKMAQKRAFVGAVILATGASDHVTQDLDDSAPATEDPAPREDMMPRERQAASPAVVLPPRGQAKVLGVDIKTGTNAKTGAQWKRYGVKLLMPDGAEIVAGTFSDTIGKEAVAAAELGALASVVIKEWSKDGKSGFNLESLAPPSEAAPVNADDVPF